MRAPEELDQVGDAFDEIKTHLVVVDAVAARAGNLLRSASVRLLVQLITVLGVIVKTRRSGRLRELCPLCL